MPCQVILSLLLYYDLAFKMAGRRIKRLSMSALKQADPSSVTWHAESEQPYFGGHDKDSGGKGQFCNEPSTHTYVPSISITISTSNAHFPNLLVS